VLLGEDIAATIAGTAERLAIVISEPIEGRTGVHRVGASVGCAIGQVTDDFSALVAAADADMYRVKRQHRAALTATSGL